MLINLTISNKDCKLENLIFSIEFIRIYKVFWNGLKYEELKKNIEKVVREIPKEKYINIIRGTYKRIYLSCFKIDLLVL
jgi:hypothetical protein